MFARILLALAMLSGPAAAQGVDVLTGRPARPRVDGSGRDPVLYNAPHAPPQARQGDDTPIDIVVEPQIGAAGAGAVTDPAVRSLRSRAWSR